MKPSYKSIDFERSKSLSVTTVRAFRRTNLPYRGDIQQQADFGLELSSPLENFSSILSVIGKVLLSYCSNGENRAQEGLSIVDL